MNSIPIDSLTDTIVAWAIRGTSRSVCIVESATVLAARNHADLRRELNAASLVVAGDRLLAWAMRFCLVSGARAVDPQSLVHSILAKAASVDVQVELTPRPDAGQPLWIKTGGTQPLVIGSATAPIEPIERKRIPISSQCRFVWHVLREAMNPNEPSNAEPGIGGPVASQPPRVKKAAAGE